MVYSENKVNFEFSFALFSSFSVIGVKLDPRTIFPHPRATPRPSGPSPDLPVVNFYRNVYGNTFPVAFT